MFAFAKCL